MEMAGPVYVPYMCCTQSQTFLFLETSTGLITVFYNVCNGEEIQKKKGKK